MDVMNAVLNTVVVVLIASTMFGAGLGTTLGALGATFRNVKLVLLVVVVNLVLVPLIGWGTAAVLSLDTPAYVALVLLACSPGAPFAAKLAMIQRGDVVTGASLQVFLAAIGSLTFAPTANAIFTAANLGGGISLPVGQLVLTVAVLQLLPFAVGLALRKWAPETATQWRGPALQISNLALVAVLALSLLGSWQQITALVASLTLLAAVIFNVVGFGIGTLVASGSLVTRTTAGLLAPARNAGPVFAAVGIAFNNDPDILGALTGILLVGLAVGVAVAAFLARHRPPPETGAEPQAESHAQADSPGSAVGARDSHRSAAADAKPLEQNSAGERGGG